MARPLRIEYPGALYHVYSRGIARQAIAPSEEDRKGFLSNLASMVVRHHVVLHAYCLLTNHYHLLMETPEGNLSRAMRHLNGTYTQRYNRTHRRIGPLFQGRFHASIVEKEAYLLEAARYIVLNPVRAGIVEHPGRWRWSSYGATAGMAMAPPWLEVDRVLGMLGRRSKEEARKR